VRELIDQQGGVDPITLQPLDLADSVDHNHKTGHVRGVLKKATNVALGCLKDCPFCLFRAFLYLLMRESCCPCRNTTPDGQRDKR
jgi:hypothetical protein